MIEPTQRAVELVARSAAAARRFDPRAIVRVARDGSGVRFELTDAPHAGDRSVACGDVELLVERGLDGLLDVGDHGLPILTPRGEPTS